MSTTDPTTSLPTASPTPSSTSNSSSTTLYLFTFLATILILFLLSASLVLRSCILRRRYRQRLRQAAADGLFVDVDRGQFDQFGFRRSTRRLGPKPVVWDTWIHPAADQQVDDDAWSNVTPVAVRCLPPPSTLSRPSPSASDLQALARPSFFPQLRLSSPFSVSPRPSSPQTPPGSLDPSTPNEKATLAVCVLVAMPDVSAPGHRFRTQNADPPSPYRRTHTSMDEDGLPLLEFGVVETKTGEWVWTA